MGIKSLTHSSPRSGAKVLRSRVKGVQLTFCMWKPDWAWGATEEALAVSAMIDMFKMRIV